MEAPPYVTNGRAALKPHGGMRTYFDGVSAFLGGETIHPPHALSAGVRGRLWEQFELPRRCHGRALLSPANTGPLRYQRQVVVLHDAAVFDFPEGFSRLYANRARRLARGLAASGATIATVSQFSRDRLVATLGLSAADVVLAPGGVHPAMPSPRSARPSLICVGGDMGHRKNVATVLAAHQLLRRAIPDVELWIVGAPGAARVWRAAAHEPAPGVTFHEPLSESELRGLVARAWANVFVPFYEGFGLPAVEAQAVGTRSILSEIPPLLEIGCADDLYVGDPHDVEGLADTMAQALQDVLPDGARSAMADNAGRLWSWKQTAETLEAALARLD